jgi:hypothetical protein
MARALQGLAIFALAIAALLMVRHVERSMQHGVDLTAFDASAVGRLDTAMWRSYYERRPVRLFWQMNLLLRRQYSMPPVMAIRNAYRAAHAAFVFKDGQNRIDYEKALPDLQRYYADVAALAKHPFDSDKAARLELEWWILHREGSSDLSTALAAEQAAIYDVPVSRLSEHAQLRADAMILRDGRESAITEADWYRIGEMLDRAWISLHDAVNAPVSAETR